MSNFVTRVSLLILAPVYFLALAAGSADACQGYRHRLKKSSRELAQFEKLVVVPLKAKRDRLQKELDQEINLPDQLRGKIVDLEKKIRELEAQEGSLNDQIDGLTQRMEKLSGEIEGLEGQKEEAMASGKKKIVKQLQAQIEEKLARRKDVRRNRNGAMNELGKTQGSIDARTERIARHREMIEEVVSQPPSLVELEEALAEVKVLLGDERQLREEKEAEVKFLEKAFNLCTDNESLEVFFQEYREAAVKIRAYGCGSVPGVNGAQVQARNDMNCR